MKCVIRKKKEVLQFNMYLNYQSESYITPYIMEFLSQQQTTYRICMLNLKLNNSYVILCNQLKATLSPLSNKTVLCSLRVGLGILLINVLTFICKLQPCRGPPHVCKYIVRAISTRLWLLFSGL